MSEKGKRKLDLRSFRWLLPYRRIAEEIEKRGGVVVTVSTEGEAFDVQVWARHRGLRVVKVVRYTGGIDVDIEKPPEAPARPAPAPAAAAPAKAAPQAAGRPVGAAPARGVSVKLVGDVDKASTRLQEPLVRADLLLASRGTRRFTVKAPARLKDVVDAAVKEAGGGCVVVNIRGLEGVAHAEVAACEDGVYAVYVEGDVGMLTGQKAAEALEELLSKAKDQVSVVATLVPRDFVDRLHSG